MKTEQLLNGLPNPLAPDSVKEGKDYALLVAKTIEKEWFNGGIIADKCEFVNRSLYVQNNRLIVRGDENVESYKEHLSRQKGDLDYLNLDWSLINISEKFCNIVSNGISPENYRIDIRANDRLSNQIKKDKTDTYKRNMVAMPLIKQAKEQLGIDLTPTGFIPEDDEELKLYMEIRERPKIEIAEEIIIDYVKKINNWQNIEESKNKDLVQVGVAVARVYTDPSKGVCVAYVDPENFGHSYIEKNDFSDAYYFFVVDTISISDLQRESEYDEITLRKIAESYGQANKKTLIYQSCPFTDILTIKVDVMRYCFKTSKTSVFKTILRNGKTVKVIKKDKNYNPPQGRSDYGKLTRTKDTWYEGNFIVGTEYIYNYKESENILRDEQNNALAPFIVRATGIYKNQLHSFLDNIKSIAKQMQYTHLKIQHLVAELKPDIIEIDEDLLVEIDTKTGKKTVNQHTLNLLNVKGVIIKKRIDMGEMGIKEGAAARPSSIQQGSALAALLNIWAHYYNLIRDITGINPARDGSLPADALLGVNRMAQLASNTATKHIVDASVDFNKKVAEVISSRVHNIFASKDAAHLIKIYERAVGKQNIEAVEALKDRGLHDFGFTVEMIPTEQERQEFKEDLTLALQEGSIDVETKNEAQQIARTNVKLANQYLFYRRRKRIKEKQDEQAHAAQLQTQSNIQASQAATQNETQAYGMKIQMDLAKEAKLSQIKLAEAQALIQINQVKDIQEFKEEVYLKQLEVASAFNLNKFKEDAKDTRVDKQSTNQSKMIEQRQSNMPSIDFNNMEGANQIFQ